MMIEFAPTPEEQTFIDSQVAEGRFKSAADVVLAALESAMRYDETRHNERAIRIQADVCAEPRGRVSVDIVPPTKEQVIAVIRAHQGELRQRGVLHLGLFGSVARDAAGPASDIDILVIIDRGVLLSLYDYIGIELYLERVLRRKVHLTDRERLKEDIRPSVEREAIDIF